jgi:glucose/mannose-6-phosphate isomerase
MITISDLEKHDPSGMHKIYDQWPRIARDSYESDLIPVNFDGIRHMVFAGMGGSGAIGDLFTSILSKTDIHVSVVKGYVLPVTVDENTLVVAFSGSGNTKETLTLLESANKLNCKSIGFSSGGKMELFCTKNNIEYRKIPFYHSPRASFVSSVYSSLHVLEYTLPIKKNQIYESITKLEEQSKNISTENLTPSNESLNLAEFLDEIPCIYYPHGLFAAAIRFKNSLHENAKMHAFVEDIIEASHNNIVSWETPSKIKPILIRGSEDYIKTIERWDIVKKYFDENNIPFREVNSVKGGILSKIMNLIYLLDYCSIYRAILSKVDPTPIKSLDYIKSKLS